jgi:hypothetical protein
VTELHERGAAHRDEAEEDEYEDVPQAVVAERVGAARVGDGREDRYDADAENDRPRDERQVNAEQ